MEIKKNTNNVLFGKLDEKENVTRLERERSTVHKLKAVEVKESNEIKLKHKHHTLTQHQDSTKDFR